MSSMHDRNKETKSNYQVTIDGLFTLLMLFLWLTGIVIAKGWWPTFFSIIFPPYSFYLVVEKMYLAGGLCLLP